MSNEKARRKENKRNREIPSLNINSTQDSVTHGIRRQELHGPLRNTHSALQDIYFTADPRQGTMAGSAPTPHHERHSPVDGYSPPYDADAPPPHPRTEWRKALDFIASDLAIEVRPKPKHLCAVLKETESTSRILTWIPKATPPQVKSELSELLAEDTFTTERLEQLGGLHKDVLGQALCREHKIDWTKQNERSSAIKTKAQPYIDTLTQCTPTSDDIAACFQLEPLAGLSEALELIRMQELKRVPSVTVEKILRQQVNINDESERYCAQNAIACILAPVFAAELTGLIKQGKPTVMQAKSLIWDDDQALLEDLETRTTRART